MDFNPLKLDKRLVKPLDYHGLVWNSGLSQKHITHMNTSGKLVKKIWRAKPIDIILA